MKNKQLLTLRRDFKLLLFYVLVLISFSSCTKNSSESTVNERIVLNRSYADQIIDGREEINIFLLSGNIPGASVSVTLDGEKIWSEGFGLANYELNAAASPETKYVLGATSKVFTTMLTAKLQEEGDIDVNNSFYSYMPDFPKKQWDFSLSQLGSISAGFTQNDYYVLLDENDYSSYLDIVEEGKNDTLNYEPGTSYLQNDYSFYLLAALSEEVKDEEFNSLVESKIIEPLGLEETTLYDKYYIIKNRSASYYSDIFARLINAPKIDYDVYAPSYGYLSTADDLNKVGQSILDTTYFTQETLDLFFTPIVTKSETGEENVTECGFGWYVFEDDYGRTAYTTYGQAIGGNSMLLVWPEQNLVVSICTNKDNPYTILPGEAISEIFLDKVDPRTKIEE